MCGRGDYRNQPVAVSPIHRPLQLLRRARAHNDRRLGYCKGRSTVGEVDWDRLDTSFTSQILHVGWQQKIIASIYRNVYQVFFFRSPSFAVLSKADNLDYYNLCETQNCKASLLVKISTKSPLCILHSSMILFEYLATVTSN